MHKILTARSLQETWVDFLLEEEFSVNPEFTRSFLRCCDPGITYNSTHEVLNAMSDQAPAADLIVKLSVARGTNPLERLALLIESRLSATSQSRRAERCLERGLAGKAAGLWESFFTVLVAPEPYIPRDEAHGFDRAISFEQLTQWICLSGPARRAFKLRRIEDAIAGRNTGVRTVDADMTAFRRAYFTTLQTFNERHGTDFTMRGPEDAYYGDTWFMLCSKSLPSWSVIGHMTSGGTVDLTFKETDFAKTMRLAELRDADMQLLKTGKYMQHVTLRLTVPKITVFNDFDAHRDEVETALHAAKRLWLLYQQRRDEFQSILDLGHAPRASLHAN